MKLNYKRTLLCGFAFFLITAFWQAYDATIPVILTNKFGMSQTWSGVIMALDNVVAVLLLPIFGAISDKHKGKRGKRTPFILVGTILAAVLLMGLSMVDNAQLKNISEVSKIDDPAALSVIYDSQSDRQLRTPDGKEFVLSEVFESKEAFMAVRSDDAEKDGSKENLYTQYVAPARRAYVAEKTAENSTELILFIVLLLALLVSMSIFRSPAVALMPDVTVKPLRSKANAIINLMGNAGGIIVLLLGIVLATSSVKNQLMSYTVYYGVIAAIMIVSLIIFLLTVKEKKWAEEMRSDSIKYHIEEETECESEKRKMTKSEKTSLIFILLSVALWYFGYNAVTSKYAVYATNILNKDYNLTMMIAQAAAIASYLPAGLIASKIGRKKTIIGGVVMLTGAFTAASFMDASSPAILMNVMFVLAGIGWATINVNSFPMAVEMCSGSDIGKYTGYYYTASMAAQMITPFFSGILMDSIAETVLFPYAAVFSGLAIVTMLFVKHGDSKFESKKSILENLSVDD
ncbi:MAG: SLC45 family MFS transporter [Ruminococcaceae bacterium]|nr:SLC45 family MFS transporter [Oscillospiraceae bacterium]